VTRVGTADNIGGESTDSVDGSCLDGIDHDWKKKWFLKKLKEKRKLEAG
jgi:hypothetical protein